MVLGFTGTKQGWTFFQEEKFHHLLLELKPSVFMHGDCLGCDQLAHREVRGTLRKTRIIIRPCDIPHKRAWCRGDMIHEPEPPLLRNKKIVQWSDMLVGIPKSGAEELRSGTWSTIRFALKKGKRVIILWPDGRREERKGRL